MGAGRVAAVSANPLEAADTRAGGAAARVTRALPGWAETGPRPGPHVIGVLPGEGIGPEGIAAALDVLDAIGAERFEVRRGGAIGLEAERETGSVLPPGIVSFVDRVFADGGALLCGPGSGRFVYELRSKFDLYCKIAPLRPCAALHDAGPLRPEAVRDADILVVRENVGGLYFGQSFERREGVRLAEARLEFRYDAVQVGRIVRVAMQIAAQRSGRLCVVAKPGGVPAVSRLWREQAERLGEEFELDPEILEVDNACFQIAADARRFDVVVAPNMFGDVVADTGALLLGSRGMSYSGNFGDARQAVYQTGHGAAYDLAGTDRSNPIGQVQSLGMLLHESFGLDELRGAIDRAIERTLGQGWRTADVMARGCRQVGTREMGRRIAELAAEELEASPVGGAVAAGGA